MSLAVQNGQLLCHELYQCRTTYIEEMVSVFVVWLQIHNWSRLAVWTRCGVHFTDRYVARAGVPHAEISGSGLSMYLSDLWSVLYIGRSTIMVSRLDDVEREPINVWELGG